MRQVAGLFANYASSLTDAFVAGSSRGDPLTVICRDEKAIEEAVAAGKGMIIATAHTGGWQLAGLRLQSLHGREMMVVMRAERDPGAQALSDAARARAGMRVAHLGEDPLAVLGLLGHLRKGGVVAMQMDRLPQGMRGRKSELFGEPFFVPEGPLRLASASGAPIVPVFTRRLGYMTYEVHVAPPVRLPRRPSPADLDAAARAVLHAMEIFVRENPTQWFHFE
jgi:KDO2-lipid IV(A) lauroyltransferase